MDRLCGADYSGSINSLNQESCVAESASQPPASLPTETTPERAAVVVVVSCLLQTLFVGGMLSEPAFCAFLSADLWTWQVELLGGTVQTDPETGQTYAKLSHGLLFLTLLAKSAALLGIVGAIAARIAGRSIKEVLLRWAVPGWLWLSVMGVYELLRLMLQICGFYDAGNLMGVFAYHFSAITGAGCLAMVIPAARNAASGEHEIGSRRKSKTVRSGSDTQSPLAPGSDAHPQNIATSGGEGQGEGDQGRAVSPSPPGGERGRRFAFLRFNRSDSRNGTDSGSWSVSRTTLIAISIFVLAFVTMNWQIYNALLLPHGDSAMYGEHLWNVTHGKGFRSYLDQGVFLGEHVQVVHLLLLPLYVVWPSQLLLELCETLTLAAGAIPVFWMARRHSGSAACGSLLAVAFLLYAPLQYLDIEVDLKTFRPMSFGVTAMLFGLDFFERGRMKSTAACFLLALSAKEDFALILGPLGVWLAIHAWRQRHAESLSASPSPLRPKRGLALGAGLTFFAAAYLLLVTRVVIPWFRGGEEVHYARYFAKFGDSLGEILITMLTNPPLLFQELVTVPSANYLLALFVPLAFLPFLSPGRLLVAAPILGLLCLNEIVKSDPFPRHHFQGPVVPILFWAAAAGLGIANRLPNESRRRKVLDRVLPGGALTLAAFACLATMQSGTMLGMSPASLSFWDAGSPNHWSRYVPGERAEHIGQVLEAIPQDSRVASTDYVHTRLIHYERSYDYSGYARKVAGDAVGVPDDTDFIVIDTKHRYSKVRSPQDVREVQTEPEKWEFLEELFEKTNRCFIVLKKRDPTRRP